MNNTADQTRVSVVAVTIDNTSGSPTAKGLDVEPATGDSGTGVIFNGSTDGQTIYLGAINSITTTVSGGAAVNTVTNNNSGNQLYGTNDFTGSYGVKIAAPSGYVVWNLNGTGSENFVANGTALAGISETAGRYSSNVTATQGTINVSGFAPGFLLKGNGFTVDTVGGGTIMGATTGMDVDGQAGPTTITSGTAITDTGTGIRAATSGGGAESVTTTGSGTIDGGTVGILASGATGTNTTTVVVVAAIGGNTAPTTAGVQASTAGTGAVSVTANASITAAGTGGTGISVAGTSANDSVTVGAGATVQGGVGLDVGGGTTTLSNGGTIATTASGGNAIQIDSGTLVIGDAAGTITGVIDDAGALDFTNTGAIAISSAITGGGTLTQNGTGTTTLSGAISGSGTLQQVLGTTVLTGADTFTGGTTIIGGTLRAGANRVLSPNSGIYFKNTMSTGTSDSGKTISATSGTLDLAGTRQTVAALSGDQPSLLYRYSNGYTYSPLTTGAGTVTNSAAAAATLKVTGVGSRFFGTIQDGTNPDGSAAGTVALDVAGSLSLFAASTFTGGTTVERGASLTLAESNGYYTAGSSPIANGSSTQPFTNGSLVGAIVDNGTLALNQRTYTYGGNFGYVPVPVTVANAISGSGGLAVGSYGFGNEYDGGAVVLSGANTYTGATVVYGGASLRAGARDVLGSNSAVSVSGLLDLAGNSQHIGSLSDGSSGNNEFGVQGGVIDNSGQGAATLFVGGSNATTGYSGTIVDGASAAGGGGIISLDSRVMSAAPPAAAAPAAAAPTGQMALDKQGTGVLSLSGTNTYSGGTTIEAGTLDLLTNQSGGTGPIAFAAGQQVLELDAAAASSSPFTDVLTGLGAGDALDLRGLDFTSGATAALSGTTLTVTSGTDSETFTLAGLDTTVAGFAVGADGAGGTAVTAFAAPALSGLADETTSHASAATPFSGATVADPNGGTDAVTIAVAGAAGTLSGTGLSANPDGSYTLTATAAQAQAAGGSAAALTKEIDALVFTPSLDTSGAVQQTVFTVSDASSVGGATPNAASQSFTYTVDSTGDRSQFGTVAHDTSSTAGQVYALYEGLLGRAPDQNGAESYKAQLDSGTPIDQVTTSFLNSQEEQSHFNVSASPSDFVNSLYQQVLGRVGDASGVSYWSQQIANGESRADVADGFVFSQEHVNDIQPALNAGVFVADSNTAEVSHLYYGLLGRAPDSAGLQANTQLLAETSPQAVAQAFLGSQEYLNKNANLSNSDFVNLLYQNALGRAPDQAGGAGWVSELNNNVSRADVAFGIAESSEAQNHLAGRIEGGFHLA